MSSYMEPSFNEFEERWVLAEILKHSSVAPGILLNLISQGQIEPGWTQIAPPFGRSVAACQTAYSHLMSRQPVNLDPRDKKMRRSVQLSETNLLGERAIQPRPPTFPSVNGGQDQQLGEDGRLKKKRGRPSKEEHEQRVAEAALRGEVYPPPKKAKIPRPSIDAVVGAGMPNTLASSSEAGPSDSMSATIIKKQPQLRPAPEKNAVDFGPGALSESIPQISSKEARTTIPTGLLSPAQRLGILAPSGSPSIETQTTKSATIRGHSEAYQSPFASEPARPLSPAPEVGQEVTASTHVSKV